MSTRHRLSTLALAVMTVLALVSATLATATGPAPLPATTFTITGAAGKPLAFTEVLLAYREDGERLDRPRLVVPGDKNGGRYVSEITDVRLIGQS